MPTYETLIVKQVLLVSTKGNVQRKVWNSIEKMNTDVRCKRDKKEQEITYQVIIFINVENNGRSLSNLFF